MYFDMDRRQRTAVETITHALDVADAKIEAGANGVCERSIKRNQEEHFGGRHAWLWKVGTSNTSMILYMFFHGSLYSIPGFPCDLHSLSRNSSILLDVPTAG